MTFTAKGRDIDTVIPLAVARGYTDVLNLGWRNFPEVTGDIRIWNPVEAVRAVSWPANLRKTLGKFLPPFPNENCEGYWWKAPGWGGKNKKFVSAGYIHEGPIPKNVDFQQHVEGQEHRINTVGESIIQAHRKYGEPGSFDWEWCGVQSLKGTGILPTIKEAVRLIPSFERTVLGWDVIYDGERTYILEVNTSMGVNDATVARIMEVMTYQEGV